MKLVLRDEVAHDLLETATCTRHTSTRFLDAVEATLHRIEAQPRLYQRIAQEIRRTTLEDFPYGVFFRIRDDGVAEVLAILHLARHPRAWRDRSVP